MPPSAPSSSPLLQEAFSPRAHPFPLAPITCLQSHLSPPSQQLCHAFFGIYILKIRKQGSERLSHLPKTTHLESARNQTQIYLILEHSFGDTSYCTHWELDIFSHAIVKKNFFSYTFHEVCRILAPWPGIQPVAPPVETQSPNHWATREFPSIFFLFFFSC